MRGRVGCVGVAIALACGTKSGSAPDAGEPVDGGALPDAGVALAIQAVAPARGSSRGGTEVVIEGAGLTVGVGVTFGGVAAAVVGVDVDGGALTVVTAPTVRGVVDVTVTVADASVRLDGGFEFFDPVTISGIDAGSGASLGGDTVVVYGSGFVAGSTVRFGDAGAVVVSVDPDGLTVTTPSG